MPSFVKGGGTFTDPFGPNEYRRSTKGLKYESYTVAAASVPTETINNVAGQKVLQRGELLAKITSGADQGKVGPFMAGTPVAEVQTITLTGTPTGGAYRLSYRGQANGALSIAYNAAASAVQSYLNGIFSMVDEQQSVTVTGSAGGPYTVTFSDPGDAGQIALEYNGLTGGTNPSVTVATTTAGTGGTGTGAVSDGRSDVANIVGINDTFLPWQLMEHDENVAALYDGEVVQAWCFMRNAAGLRVPVDDSVARYLKDRKGLHIHFH